MKVSKKQALQRIEHDERVVALTEAEILALTDTPQFVAFIGRAWEDVRERFLLIGRALNRAKAVLPRGDFDRMIRDQLPFTPAIGYQLRAVAIAVDGDRDNGLPPRLGLDELPKSYSAAYQLTTLQDDELTAARRRGLVNPDVRRAAIIEFKATLKKADGRDAEAPGMRVQRLLKERARLQDLLRAVESELTALDVDLS